jgi:hypothetical protein
MWGLNGGTAQLESIDVAEADMTLKRLTRIGLGIQAPYGGPDQLAPSFDAHPWRIVERAE